MLHLSKMQWFIVMLLILRLLVGIAQIRQHIQ